MVQKIATIPCGHSLPYILTLLVALLTSGWGSAEACTAKLARSDDQDFARLSFGTRFQIEVKLPAAIESEKIKGSDKVSVVVKETKKPIAIKAVTLGPPEDLDSLKTRQLVIWADVNPSLAHLIKINWPITGELLECETKPDATTAGNASPSLFQWLGDRASILVEPNVASGNNIGVKYKFDLFLASPTEFLDLTLNSEGDVGTGDEGFQSLHKASVNLSYFVNLPILLDLPNGKRTYVYPMGFRAGLLGFETDRDLNVANYVFELRAVGAIPYLDAAFFWLFNAFGAELNRPFFPPTLSVGYTYSPNILKKEVLLEEMTHRLDFELLQNLPLGSQTDFLARWRYFDDLESAESASLLELSLTFYFDNQLKNGATISYQSGSLPPKFKDSSSFKLGFSFKTF